MARRSCSGHRIKPGGGQKDGEAILDLLARHPSTARFIATKLARRFVADDPPAALVDRAARKFKDTDGDIREVVRTIVTSPEFLGDDYRRAKTKNPFEFVVSAVRATELDISNALPLVQSLRDLGMPHLWRAAADRIRRQGRRLGQFRRAAGSHELCGRADRRPDAWARFDVRPRPRRRRKTHVGALFSVALADDVSASTAATVAKATTPAQTVALILGSPEFQKR